MPNISRNRSSKFVTCGSAPGASDRFRLDRELARITGLQFGDQTLGLPDVQALLDDALGGEFLLFLVGKTENDFCVADRKPPFADKILDDLRQFQQPQRIGHHRAAFADFERRFPPA